MIRRDDERDKIGSLHVIHRDGRFVAAYVITMRGGEGAISTLDPDAGTWYVDEPVALHAAMSQCSGCSRFGHNTEGCCNVGAVCSIKQRKAIRRLWQARDGLRRHVAAIATTVELYA